MPTEERKLNAQNKSAKQNKSIVSEEKPKVYVGAGEWNPNRYDSGRKYIKEELEKKQEDKTITEGQKEMLEGLNKSTDSEGGYKSDVVIDAPKTPKSSVSLNKKDKEIDNLETTDDSIVSGGMELTDDEVKDFYSDSLSSMWDGLNDKSKKMLALNQVFTTLKNMSKFRPYMGSIYGRSHEGTPMGDEKSLLEKGMEKAFEQGLNRSDERKRTLMQQKLKQKGWSEELQRMADQIMTNNKLSLNQKVREIQKLGKLDKETLQKYALANNPYAGEMAIGKSLGSIPMIGGALEGAYLYNVYNK